MASGRFLVEGVKVVRYEIRRLKPWEVEAAIGVKGHRASLILYSDITLTDKNLIIFSSIGKEGKPQAGEALSRVPVTNGQ